RGSLMVLTFVPFRSEADLWPLIHRLRDSDIAVVVPKVNREQHSMELYVVVGAEDLEAGHWGIREPRAGMMPLQDDAKIDAVIVPGLAFDREGGRLGYGAGYYDRLFRRFEEEGLRTPIR